MAISDSSSFSRELLRWVQTHKQRCVIIVLMASLMMMLIFGLSGAFVRGGISYNGLDPIYKVVIDAGSTGTRIHVFEFVYADNAASEFVLRNYPLFSKVEGGLSEFAERPEECESGLRDLMNMAKAIIPPDQWRATQVTLMATAGLRLLPPSQAEGLLRSVRKTLSESPFALGTVGIIDGKAEAKYIHRMASFVTTNQDMAIVDLGGGSVQLAYRARDSPQSEYVKKFVDPNSNMYLNSWLGYGLVAFRMKALEEQDPPGSAHPCVPEWTPKGTVYEYAGKERVVVAADDSRTTRGKNGLFSMDGCVAVIKAALNVADSGQCKISTRNLFRGTNNAKNAADNVCGLDDQYIGKVGTEVSDWMVFSYIYDLAKAEGLVSEHAHQGELTPNQFLQAAQTHCESATNRHSLGGATEWWKCIDLVYVSVLLTHGFGIPHNSPVTVTKRLFYRNRMEIEAAWPLGAALELLVHN